MKIRKLFRNAGAGLLLAAMLGDTAALPAGIQAQERPKRRYFIGERYMPPEQLAETQSGRPYEYFFPYRADTEICKEERKTAAVGFYNTILSAARDLSEKRVNLQVVPRDWTLYFIDANGNYRSRVDLSRYKDGKMTTADFELQLWRDLDETDLMGQLTRQLRDAVKIGYWNAACGPQEDRNVKRIRELQEENKRKDAAAEQRLKGERGQQEKKLEKLRAEVEKLQKERPQLEKSQQKKLPELKERQKEQPKQKQEPQQKEREPEAQPVFSGAQPIFSGAYPKITSELDWNEISKKIGETLQITLPQQPKITRVSEPEKREISVGESKQIVGQEMLSGEYTTKLKEILPTILRSLEKLRPSEKESQAYVYFAEMSIAASTFLNYHFSEKNLHGKYRALAKYKGIEDKIWDVVIVDIERNKPVIILEYKDGDQDEQKKLEIGKKYPNIVILDPPDATIPGRQFLLDYVINPLLNMK